MSSDRRHFIKHAMAGAAVAAPGLEFLTGLRAQAQTMRRRQKSLIILWMSGGPTTIDLWDMKPGNANGGEHRPRATAAGSAVQISEHLPKVGAQFRDLSIIRSLSTSEGDHARGTYLMNHGRSPNPLTPFPSIGSVLSYYQGMDVEAMRNADLPAFISVGGTRGESGFLGMKYAPFTVQNAGSPPENVSPPNGADMLRRAALFNRLEGGFTSNVSMDAARAHREVYEKALAMVVSTRKDVFSLDKEANGQPISAALKEEYGAAGPGANGFGRAALLARKLVEAGTACVQIELGGWDMHNQIFPTLANQRLPTLDKAMGTLVKDLKDRGKLQDTVIVWMGDFGRTPRINQNAGRDHFPRAWSVVVGGGNIKGGMAYGATSADGMDVTDKKVGILDLYATLYKGLGIDPTPETNASVRDNLGRPYYIAGDKPTWITDLVS
ncbi:DUF1501 domain-containing protein [Urbifossiella limnaea]|uniref:DUF1501 domain-containing protein n=1 Tax=Urbifossiella limnaea TaxID=2528023 RepID=A0A517XUK7_9BACT|nr:DUF1501 domain-containing protein [Urbifossiella limnaea]QDU21181.1 hypothetical protein ETAA1_31460 [Urbifossiella limnaea]